MFQVTAPVRAGFWKIKTKSMIDYPQEQRFVEILDNGDGTGTIRSAALTHDFEKAKMLATTDNQCQFYLDDHHGADVFANER